jgi:hypothetical protein
MNADWHGDINFGSTRLSLDIISLDIALYTMLHKLIGIKWLAEEGLLFLEMSTMRDWFTS